MKSINARVEELLEHTTANYWPYKIRQQWKIKSGSSFFNSGHPVDKKSVKLLGLVADRKLLDAFESSEITEGDDAMNNDKGPIIFSCLYSLLE